MTQGCIWVLLIFTSPQPKAICSSISISLLFLPLRLLNANRAWLLDQAFLQCLLRPKQVQTIPYHNLCILFLLMKYGILILCLEVHSSPWRNALCWFFVEIYIVPREVLAYFLQHPCTISVLPAAILLMLWFMVSDIFRSPSFPKDGVCIAFFHSPCCFGMVSETRRGECQVYSTMFDLVVLSRSNFLSQAGLPSPYDFQTLPCASSLYAAHTLVISNLSLKRLHGSSKVSDMIGTQVSWFLVHVLTVLHIYACIWPQNSTDLLSKQAYCQKLTLRLLYLQKD